MLWIWRNLRMDVPDDWEMLQYSRDPRNGRIAFADRYQIRFEMRWREAPGKPDLDRMVADYLSKLQLDLEMAEVGKLKIGAWSGFQGTIKSLLTSRFLRYLPGESRVVEAILVWPQGREPSVERAILDSIDEQRKTEVHCRWRVFGMDLAAMKNLELKSVRFEPGLAELRFAGASKTPIEEFSRRGMVKEWLGGTVREWLVGRVPLQMNVLTLENLSLSSHEIEVIEAEGPATGLARLQGKTNRFSAAAWICPDNKRLFFASRLALRGEKRDTPIGDSLSCCTRKKLAYDA